MQPYQLFVTKIDIKFETPEIQRLFDRKNRSKIHPSLQNSIPILKN